MPLRPYFSIVNCVKAGDMVQFNQIMQMYGEIFKRDKNCAMILRLRHTVLKFGLKKLNISYSKITLADIKAKLSLESIEETEQIVSKAIRDGVISAVINKEGGFMQSKEVSDIYATNDPQNLLDKRIRFCMELHKEATKALDYPQQEDKRDFGDLEEVKSTNDADLLEFLDELDMDDI